MRILHATKRYPDSSGGDGVVVHNLRARQRGEGHDVHVLTSNCPDIRDDHQVYKVGLPIESAAIDRIGLRRIVTLVWLAAHAFVLLRRVRPDVIHSHTMDFGFALSFAARLYRIPTVNTCHGICFNNPDFPRSKRLLEVFLLRRARHRRLITVDANSLEAFDEVGLEPVEYHPNAVPLEQFRTRRPRADGTFRMLFVGRLTAIKGVPVLLDALARIVERHPEVHLTLVGEGEGAREYAERVERSGLGEHVTFLGRRSGQEVAELYTRSDLFVLPSLHEGFPLVLLEAWASALPAVITRVGTASKVCSDGENVLLVEPGDVHGLQAAVERVLTDPLLHARLGRAGRVTVESRYTYAATTRLLDTVYAEVLPA